MSAALPLWSKFIQEFFNHGSHGCSRIRPILLNKKPSPSLIRAGREIRGQKSLSIGVRKKLNRELRESTRKEDEEAVGR
jgi:hypothetical protein